MITVPNDHVGQVIDPDASALEAFRVVDEVLLKAVEGIVELLTAPGLINLDFADIRIGRPGCRAGVDRPGRGSRRRSCGRSRRVRRRRARCSRPASRAPAACCSTSPDPRTSACARFGRPPTSFAPCADPRANVIFGASIGAVPEDEVQVTLIATGLIGHRRPAVFPRPTPLVRATPAATPAVPAVTCGAQSALG